ncbi:MAG: hypothetical protein JSS28_07255 [Proteobacteria bacterium]|nr:hypothetical protein [Pseudomonadota bacterium]
MNDEFRWRNALRNLGGEVEPQRELWPQIAARIAVRPTIARWRMGLGLTAMLLLTCGASVLAWRMQSDEAMPVAQTKRPTPTAEAAPLAWAVPANPVLATAARDLDSASVQLQQALDTHPRAVFLVGLINRTNEQRMRLLRQERGAG